MFITLVVTEKVKLTYNNIVYGVLELKEKYVPNKVEEVNKAFQTTDSQHHGVKITYTWQGQFINKNPSEK
ncbi:hypothetical protein [Bacillus thuringiensis]|uniref:hypothetical protein n=1 Tax=Bacillus thuringiensis TaxID=1428 RepID=UPI003C6BEA16